MIFLRKYIPLLFPYLEGGAGTMVGVLLDTVLGALGSLH